MKLDFENYKDELFGHFLSGNHHDRFLILIEQLHKQGRTKNEIYELFVDFHIETQIDSRTKGNESDYDNLSDFMDGFVGSVEGFKILLNESYR